jgi:hypothetical protein
LVFLHFYFLLECSGITSLPPFPHSSSPHVPILNYTRIKPRSRPPQKKKKSAYFTHPDFSVAKIKKSAQITRENTVFGQQENLLHFKDILHNFCFVFHIMLFISKFIFSLQIIHCFGKETLKILNINPVI